MASWYVYSGATGAANGSSWADAMTTLAAAAAAAAAGDTIYVAHDHNENSASAVTITFAGTATAPNLIFCVNRGGSVPPGEADLAHPALNGLAATTGYACSISTGTLILNGAVYQYGLTYNCSSTISFNSMSETISERVAFNLVGTSSAYTISQNADGMFEFMNCSFGFSNTGQLISFSYNTNRVRGKYTNFTGTLPTSPFRVSSSRGTTLILDSLDLSAFGTGKTLFQGSLSNAGNVQIINCKLGVGVTIAGQSLTPGLTYDVITSDSGAMTSRNERYVYSGQYTTETNVILDSNPANDGALSYSHKIVTNAYAKLTTPYDHIVLMRPFPLTGDTKTLGQPVTATIEVMSTAQLTNQDIWVEAVYLPDAADLRGDIASSGLPTLLSTPTNLPASPAVWDGGVIGAMPQRLQVTFTPQMNGYVRFLIRVAKPNATIYVDPQVTLS